MGNNAPSLFAPKQAPFSYTPKNCLWCIAAREEVQHAASLRPFRRQPCWQARCVPTGIWQEQPRELTPSPFLEPLSDTLSCLQPSCPDWCEMHASCFFCRCLEVPPVLFSRACPQVGSLSGTLVKRRLCVALGVSFPHTLSSEVGPSPGPQSKTLLKHPHKVVR